MIDTHAHIFEEYYENIYTLIEEEKENNVERVINCADSIKTSKEVINLSKSTNGFLKPAIGMHPENIESINNIGNSISELENIIKNNKVIAIGEIGLDYHYNKTNKENQKELFIRQLHLAEKYNLPVIIHTRDSIQDCLDILKKANNHGIIHCFSGSYEMAKEFIKIGFYLGIGGVLTFKNSKLYEVIEKIDISKIVLETDSPYLSPEPLRGKQNRPSNIYYVAKKIAEIKSITVEEVIKITTENAKRIFDI